MNKQLLTRFIWFMFGASLAQIFVQSLTGHYYIAAAFAVATIILGWRGTR